MRWGTYEIAKNVEEVLDYLEFSQGKARVIAGGTDLVLQLLEKKESEYELALLDISSVQSIRGIELADDGKWILVGAATTMAELAGSEIIKRHGRALALGASLMGSPQIRNVATIGGNVANAQPAADGAIPLVALGADARIVSTVGEKWVAVEDLFLDVGRSLIDPAREIITHFRFQVEAEGSISSVHRLAKRKAFALPTLLVAARVALDEKKETFENVRLAAGPVATTPWFAHDAADSLSGAPVTYEAIDRAAALAKAAAHPRDSLRGGAEYRKEMVHVLVKRALFECVSLLGVPVDG